MPRTIEINRPTEAFDDHMDTSRNNADRKPWGKHEGALSIRLADEYDEPALPPTQQPGPPAPVEQPQKFTHKLSNGTVLEAESVEGLAAKIEQALQTPVQPPAEVAWDDAPTYKPVEFKRKELTVQEQADLLNQWGQNPQKALRALEEAEYGVSMDRILEVFNRSEVREMQRAQEVAAVEFMEECAESYRATTANGKKLTEYLREKQKPITKNNLVKAFRDLSANDKTLVREAEPETPPAAEEPDELPPTTITSNQGEPPVVAAPTVDVEKFKRLSLEEQKKYFATVRRGA